MNGAQLDGSELDDDLLDGARLDGAQLDGWCFISWRLCKIQLMLDSSSMLRLMSVFIILHLDYCNGMLAASTVTSPMHA